MQDDLTIKLPDEPAAPTRMSYETALSMPRPFQFIDASTGTLTTLSGGTDPTDPRRRPAPPLLKCQGQGVADPLTAMGVPGVPSPVVAPTAAQRKKMLTLPVLTYSEAIASSTRPLVYRDAATNVITTLN